MMIDSLIHARWIVPVIPQGVVYENYSLAVHQGIILDLLPTAQAWQQFKARQTFELGDHCVFPGLINAHTHSPMSLLRGLADDLPLMRWLQDHIWPAESRFVDSRFVQVGTRLAIAEMIRSGTTCFHDMYFFPEITAQVCDKIGMRAAIGQILIDFPSAWAKNPDEYLAKGLSLHEHYHDHPLISTCMAPHAPYTVNDENLLKVKLQAESLDIPIHMHVHETQDEIDRSLQTYHKRPLQRLADLGLLSSHFIAVHMTHINPQDKQLLQEYPIHIVHCAESNMKLASGFAPVQSFLDSGYNVALGTDSAASNNDLDMLGEMKSAALLAKISNHDATAGNAETVLSMATINAARALGLSHHIGSLERGKQADIAALNFKQIETQPVYHPISQLVYAASRNQVTHVWINGVCQLNEGHLARIKLDDVFENISYWQQQLEELK